jgi:hypothetical protein
MKLCLLKTQCCGYHRHRVNCVVLAAVEHLQLIPAWEVQHHRVVTIIQYDRLAATFVISPFVTIAATNIAQQYEFLAVIKPKQLQQDWLGRNLDILGVLNRYAIFGARQPVSRLINRIPVRKLVTI